MLRGAWFASALVSLWFPGYARGELVTVKFSGTVTSVSVHPLFQSYDFPDVGDSFTGYYRFDSTTQDSASLSDRGSFRTSSSQPAIGVTIGDFQFEGTANQILTFQNQYSVADYIPSIELTSHPELAQILGRKNFTLTVKKENLYSDPNILPLSPPSLDQALERFLRMAMSRPLPGPGEDVIIQASLDSLTVVPEPSTLPLSGGALALSMILQRAWRGV
jgi:hypothetical protein